MALSRLALDTSAYTHFRLGHGDAVEHVSTATWVGMPIATVAELLAGFAGGRRRDVNEAALGRFLGGTVVEVIPADLAVARQYAAMYGALRHAGTPVPTNDLWIAAAATTTRATVLTFDAHFTRIPEVDVLLLTR